MEDLNGKEYKHRRLVCKEAKPSKKKKHTVDKLVGKTTPKKLHLFK